MNNIFKIRKSEKYDVQYWKLQNQPPGVFYKKGVLRNFTKLTGKHLCQSLFFNKVAGLKHTFFYKTAPVDASDFVYNKKC